MSSIDPESPLYLRFQAAFNNEPEAAARAPGRVEFIGNHTDYNGGLVIGLAVEQGVSVLARLREDRVLRFTSTQGNSVVESNLDGIERLSGEDSWANYPLGVIKAMIAKGAHFESGIELAVDSDLPAGAGMSSSAALELATAYALAHLVHFPTDKATLARVCQIAENSFVGVPCGVFDQGVVAFGEAGKLVRIDFRKETFTTLPLGDNVRIWVFNTEQNHSLVDSFYSDRNAECMEAARILSAQKEDASVLADFSEAEVRAAQPLLTPVLFKRALHVVTEIERVRSVEAALAEGDLARVGECLFASHESSRTLFENSIEELDVLVKLLKMSRGVYGARLTGGGFGGAVMALTSPEFSPQHADIIAADYAAQFGSRPDILKTAAADGAGVLV